MKLFIAIFLLVFLSWMGGLLFTEYTRTQLDPATQERAKIRERLRDLEGFMVIHNSEWEPYRMHMKAIRELRKDVKGE